MVKAFNMLPLPKIIFGPGRSSELPSLLNSKGGNILVITGSESHRRNKDIASVIQALDQSGLPISYTEITGEPSPAEIDQITESNRRYSPRVVVSIGGGSALDAGKAVSAMLTVDQPICNYLEGVGKAVHPGTKVFFVAVPTTSGTGSEATANAVISQTGQNGFKRSLRHENFVPDIALVDPLLTQECPPEITANSGMDTFTQLVESYLSLKAQPFSDALALDGITYVHNSLLKAVKNGKDITARSGMSYAALLSGICLANAGLGLIHGFASSVGGYKDIPHGVVCGSLMGIVNRFNMDKLFLQDEITVAHEKYAMIGKLLSGREDLDMKDYMKFAVDYMDNLTDVLQLKRIGEYGITEDDLPAIALATDHKANPVKFSNDDLVKMLFKRV
jgi:alcohol dehydrogenase class IV